MYCPFYTVLQGDSMLKGADPRALPRPLFCERVSDHISPTGPQSLAIDGQVLANSGFDQHLRLTLAVMCDNFFWPGIV
jgi:hypothetical protein